MAKQISFHNGNRWNYGFQKQKDGSVRAFRYHTNGHQNGSKEFAHVVVYCKELPKNHEEAESLYASPSSWGRVTPLYR
jgi:hypothetical protein